jgi:hypothetical protein
MGCLLIQSVMDGCEFAVDSPADWRLGGCYANFSYDTRYEFIGVGYCRGPQYPSVDQKINSRIRQNPDSTDADCADVCMTLAACAGYAYGQTRGRCILYGPGLDNATGLAPYAEPVGADWEGVSHTNVDIGRTVSAVDDVVCMRKASATNVLGPVYAGGAFQANSSQPHYLRWQNLSASPADTSGFWCISAHASHALVDPLVSGPVVPSWQAGPLASWGADVDGVWRRCPTADSCTPYPDLDIVRGDSAAGLWTKLKSRRNAIRSHGEAPIRRWHLL